MGAGGRLNVPRPDAGRPDGAAHHRVPVAKPAFTMSELRAAIPPHCMKRDVLKSFSYVVYDLLIVASAYLLASAVIPAIPPALRLAAWPLYWAVTGCVLTGVWAIAHDCGHHAFSDYIWLDDTVGLILHSALLVPYFSWKYSHRRHHSNTGSLENDEVFVPRPKSELAWFAKYGNNPVGRVLWLAGTLTLGWPLYLGFNVSGRKYDQFACHFDPYGPIYNDRERAQVFVSDAAILATLVILGRLAVTRGLSWVICYYGVPLLIVNAFLVLITYLQHTHAALPHYDSSEWDWLRGALATVDRDYGLLNKVFHHVTDSHVVHHLISTMPHYHTVEATKALRPMLGEYYHYDSTPVYKAAWREAKECVYVEPDDGSPVKGVFWYRHKF